MQRARAMGHRQRIARADVSGEFLLEFLGLRAGRDPSGAQRVDYFTFFGWTDRGSMKWNLAHVVGGLNHTAPHAIERLPCFTATTVPKVPNRCRPRRHCRPATSR